MVVLGTRHFLKSREIGVVEMKKITKILVIERCAVFSSKKEMTVDHHAKKLIWENRFIESWNF